MEQSLQATEYPVWFNGKTVNEALFCEEFLREHKMLITNGAFFTPDGTVTTPLPLRREIYDKLRTCVETGFAKRIGNIVEVLKLEAQVEDFPLWILKMSFLWFIFSIIQAGREERAMK